MAQDVLQLYHTLKLCSPTLSLSAFCKALSEAAWRSESQQVGARHVGSERSKGLADWYQDVCGRASSAQDPPFVAQFQALLQIAQLTPYPLLLSCVCVGSHCGPSTPTPSAALLTSSATACWTCGWVFSSAMTWSALRAVAAAVLTI